MQRTAAQHTPLSRLLSHYWRAYQNGMDLIDPFPYWRTFDRHRCLFIHIPKAAGTSVLNAIGARKRLHMDWSIYMLADPGKFRRYYKFCFVRNPWDRAYSTYTYLKRGGAGQVDAWFQQEIQARYPDFASWVTGFLDERRIHEHALLRPQYLFIYDGSGTCMVDFVGRFERINEDFETVRKRLGLKKSLPYLNNSQDKQTDAPVRKGYQSHFTPELEERIRQLYARDIELFDYQFAPDA